MVVVVNEFADDRTGLFDLGQEVADLHRGASFGVEPKAGSAGACSFTVELADYDEFLVVEVGS